MRSRFESVYGSLLGHLFADALGSTFEGSPTEQLRNRFSDREAAFDYAAARDALRYTDDGQMMLAIAEYLSEHETIDPNRLMRCFVEVYESWRGYGRGARVLIEAFRDRADYEFMAEHLFPGGSLGNGGAMRSSPVGLRYGGDLDRIWAEAKQSAWPTHRHELGVEGAQLIALATSLAHTEQEISPGRLSELLLPHCGTVVFQNRIRRLADVTSDNDISQFGNGIEAHESVVTALACFGLFPDDYRSAVSTAFWQGGDTDTIGAMTGRIT
ncbi:MAG: ADP-ribosylglycohydrolase family protein [Planctomycetales bacterium]|nr:ADP-ribosylglycohydrolase family protein [Planctomycetales bacterium]